MYLSADGLPRAEGQSVAEVHHGGEEASGQSGEGREGGQHLHALPQLAIHLPTHHHLVRRLGPKEEKTVRR
eukprot:1075-Prorocentrum_minimum.AAC.1